MMMGAEALVPWRAEWESESYPESRDLVMIPAFSVFFVTVRYLLDSFVFEPLGKRFINKVGHQKDGLTETESLQKTVVKFKESCWKLCYFLSAEILALVVSYNEPYFTDTRAFWLDPGKQHWPDQKVKLKLKFLYAFAGGFYGYSIVALISWETRRKDFSLSMLHHVTSEGLIVFSYLARFARVGCVVLAVHDGSDMLMEFAKLTKYSGLEIISSVCFVMFAIWFFVLRLIVFPFWVIRSTSYEVLTVLNRDFEGGPLLYYLFNTLLVSLLVLHIYWWILIWRMIVGQIKAGGKISDDIRSDSEEEEPDEEEE